jgi:hypothetical protein
LGMEREFGVGATIGGKNQENNWRKLEMDK